MSIRTPFVFSLGLVIGMAVTSGQAQDRRLAGVNGVNHVAFVTKDYDAMKTFYTQTMGFPEAFTARNSAGEPTLSYFQASRNTFIELFPPGATRTAGFSHFGVHVDNVEALAARLRERGVQAAAPRISGSGALTVTISDPDGNRIELSELGADAPARKAMEAWK